LRESNLAQFLFWGAEMPEPETIETPKRTARWSIETRRWVILALIIGAVWLVYQELEILPPIILALLLAYLLNPLVTYLYRRQRIPRFFAVVLIYLALILVLIGAVSLLTPVLVREVRGLFGQLDQILASVNRVPWLDTLGIHIDSASLADQLRAEMATLASALPRVLVGAASSVLSVVLVLVLSFYLLIDAEAIGHGIDGLVPVDYREEWHRIKSEFGRIWSSFLRGQVVLAIIIGTIVTLTLMILGVPNAFFLGLLAGVLEVVPNIGPIIAMIPAVLIALFQGSHSWAIDNTVFAIIVVAAYTLIQQLENHIIVPKVIGESVNLPPVVILIGAFAGANLAGVLGIFLAAPVLATARVVGEFVIRKLLEPVE
jgi:predicted PurR-regulated permease PerM